MSRKFLSFNKSSGLLTTTAFEEGRNVVCYEQDLEPYWDANAQYRTQGDAWAKGMKDEGKMTHVAFVPDLVIMDMLTKHGVNFYDDNDSQRVKYLIETEYQNCKVVDKKLWIPTSKTVE